MSKNFPATAEMFVRYGFFNLLCPLK